MAGVTCRYCSVISERDSEYPRRRARHSLDSSHPRCDVHWRFTCSVCGRARHFNGVSFCPGELKFYCIGCAPEHRAPRRAFWAWSYHYSLRCPWHEEWHAALDRLEFEGRHPWQLSASMRRAKTGMSRSEEIPEYWQYSFFPIGKATESDVRRGWDGSASEWASRYSPRGDLNREWVLDPVLLRFLGGVKGLRILDAGCGGGYLARILARGGARVDGVDISPKMIHEARKQEKQRPLGIRYRRGNLASLSFFADGTFDKAVSNVVLQDVLRLKRAVKGVYRVLKPGGRFVFSITHPAFEAPLPGRWVKEPEDSERHEDRLHRAVDRYFDRVFLRVWQEGRPLGVGFHRPLRDYFEAVSDAGFLVARVEEPQASAEAVRKHYRQFANLERIPLFLIVEAVKPRRGET